MNNISSPVGFSLSAFIEAVRGRPIKTFLICLAGVTLSTMDQALFSYAIPGIMEDFGVGLEVPGRMLSLSFLVAAFTVIVAGVLTDYFGRRRMFIAMLALSALFVGCHALAQTIGWLTLFRILAFAVAAGLYPVTATIVIEVAPARYRGMLSAWLQMSYPIGFAIGALLASGLLAEYGWRITFYPAFLVIPMAFVLGAMLKETDRFKKTAGATPAANAVASDSEAHLETGARRPVHQHLAELLSPQLRSRTLICFAGTICSNMAIAGATYFLPTFLYQDRGVSQADAAGMLVWSWGIAAIGYFIASYVGEFLLTRRDTVILYQWLGAVCFAVTLWFFDTPTLVMLGLGISTMFFFGSESMRMPLVTEIFPTRLRATASASVGSVAVSIASFVTPLIISSVVPHLGWNMTFTIFAVIPLLVAGAIFTRLENFPAGVEVEELSS